MITITIYVHAPPNVRLGLVALIIKTRFNDQLLHHHSLIFCQSEIKVPAGTPVLLLPWVAPAGSCVASSRSESHVPAKARLSDMAGLRQ